MNDNQVEMDAGRSTRTGRFTNRKSAIKALINAGVIVSSIGESSRDPRSIIITKNAQNQLKAIAELRKRNLKKDTVPSA